ncbi:MAG TPA: protein translocase SEC61 complex subunit gamma [Methanocorpusculum sp.]|nr:protein translocase SEC61 complex subunit gamma [Methanocorpusculum sp.]
MNIKKPEITKESVSEFFRKYIRVLKLARRPTKEEFWKISAVAAIGIALIGVIGFVIALVFKILP